jgi:hypothetical protein
MRAAKHWDHMNVGLWKDPSTKWSGEKDVPRCLPTIGRHITTLRASSYSFNHVDTDVEINLVGVRTARLYKFTGRPLGPGYQ